MKKHMKGSDGKYHIKGQKFDMLIGSRAQVFHGTAYKTSGGLTKAGLKKNKHGNIVSRAKSAKGAQMLKRLTNKGYFTRKGKFGYVKKAAKKTRKAHGKKKVKAIRGVKWEDRNRKTGRFAKKPSYKKRK
jgi:hypothetical protein